MAAPSAPAQRGLRGAVVAFRYRDFRLFWTGALISNIGTWMQNLTVPYALLYVMHTSAVWVGIATISQFLPGVILGPLAGWMADRFNRRVLLLVSQVVQLVLALALWAAWVAGLRDPFGFVALVALNGVVFGITMASWQSFVTELVPRSDLLNAITLNSAQFNGARAFGPALAGLVLARWGPGAAFLANALSFLAVVIALAMIKTSSAERLGPGEPVMRQFAIGARYARQHTGIVVAIAVITLVGLFGMPVGQMANVMAKKVYHLDAGQFGLLGAAYGVGAVIGAVGLGSLGGTVRRSRLVLGAVTLYAVSLVLFGLAPNFPGGALSLALCGVAFLSASASLNTSVQLIVAEDLRGRVMAIYAMALTASFPIGALIQTALADSISPRLVLVGAGACLGFVALGLAMRPRWLLSLEEEQAGADRVLEPLPPVIAVPPVPGIQPAGGS